MIKPQKNRGKSGYKSVIRGFVIISKILNVRLFDLTDNVIVG